MRAGDYRRPRRDGVIGSAGASTLPRASKSADDKEGTVRAEIPSRDDGATITCPVCRRVFTPSGRGRYCGDPCRKKAWRRRRQATPAPVVVPPAGARRPITVYECAACGTRALGDQRCGDCGAFMGRVGYGGLCPHCDGAVAIYDLLDEQHIGGEQPKGGRR